MCSPKLTQWALLSKYLTVSMCTYGLPFPFFAKLRDTEHFGAQIFSTKFARILNEFIKVLFIPQLIH